MSQISRKSNSTSDNPRSKNSRESRAKRLKRLRGMTKRSRKDFAVTYGISQGTIQNWETARFGGLTEKGAHLILSALKSENIFCTFEWLMYGAGMGPQKALPSTFADLHEQSNIQHTHRKNRKPAHPNGMQIEKKHFKDLHHDILSLTITNDAMTPFYYHGDFVAGPVVSEQYYHQLIGKICILQTENNGTILRKVRASTTGDTYHLLATNIATSIEQPTLYNVCILKAAPVIWTRRHDG